MAWWGRARSSFAFRTVTPSTAICIKMEEKGEKRGEEAGRISGRRERRGEQMQKEKRAVNCIYVQRIMQRTCSERVFRSETDISNRGTT